MRDIAHSVAKVRLGLMLDKGPNYGLGQEDRTQAQTEGTRCTATSTMGANAPLLVPAADLLPPAERLAALEMAIANLEQTEPDGTSALCTALAETEEAPQARSTDSLGGALSHRLVSRLSLSPDTFLQVIPLTRPGRLAVLRTAAHCPARWAADSFAEYGSEVISTDRFCLQRQGKGSGLGLLPECAQRSSVRLAVIRTPSFCFTPCGHHCALGRARQGPRFRPTCHTPSISRNFQVPSEWFGYSRCWTRIPGILQRMQCQKPLHPASYQPVLLYCCQLSLHKVPYRTSPAARLRQGRGATTVGWVCSNGMPLGRRSRCTGMPIQSRQGRMRYRLPPSSSRAGVARQAGSFEPDPCAPPRYSAPHRALPTLKSSQVRVAAMPRTAYSARGDQAGPLTALLPADLDHELLRLSVPCRVFQCSWACIGSDTRLDLQLLSAYGGELASPQLLVALHTALAVVDSVSANMPSPSAKLKASRRLPKRLRLSGEQPTGEMARSRAEASDRHACQHSCYQGKRHSDDTAASQTRWQDASWEWHAGWSYEGWGDEWQNRTASGSGDAWVARPKPPTPPSPRWRPKMEDSGARSWPTIAVATAAKSRPRSRQGRSITTTAAPDAGQDLMARDPTEQTPTGPTPAYTIDTSGARTAEEPEPGKDGSGMVEVEIEVELSPSEKDTSGASAAERHGVEDPAEDHVEAPPDQAGKRSSAPDSDSEELVPVESDPETEAGQVGRRCPAPDSDSEELAPAAPSRDEGARPGEEKASNSPEHSRTSACNASQLRPWTQQDTDLCKALTRVLRHRSNLKLDEAGYAKLTDVLVHPLTRRLKPTMDWIMYIVRANAKQRFALDEAGARIRAVQGHSIPVDSSQLLRRLESGDLGETVPTWALHSTYFSCIPSIMRHGLLPGGTRGTCYRRHVHLAMSYHPTAGLREGSDVILVIDLMRAHNAGCVFYVSDNNVILTADCIPPPCIARAQRTSTGEAYDLSKFRAAYKVVTHPNCWPSSSADSAVSADVPSRSEHRV